MIILETYEMTLSPEGTFNESFTTDQQACMINESAVKDFDITDLDKTRFMEPGDSGKMNYLQVIGVVKNFNFESLRNPIRPYIFRFQNDGMSMGICDCKAISTELSGDNHCRLKTYGKNYIK